MLCDGDFICLWSPHCSTESSNGNNSNAIDTSMVADVWACTTISLNSNPMQELFGHRELQSPQVVCEPSTEELYERVLKLLQKQKSALDEEDKKCLRHLLAILQQLDMETSAPASLGANSSGDEPSSLEMVKSRTSDCSSISSSSATGLGSSLKGIQDQKANSKLGNSATVTTTTTNNSRIVATVQPYNSSSYQQQSTPTPNNSPNDSPKRSRTSWQSTSLSESGVFVESDFLSDISEHNAWTQTDFEESQASLKGYQKFPRKVPASVQTTPLAPGALEQLTGNLQQQYSDQQKRLQYYKDRVELLEGKILIYESSGELQAKRLADRLQREIQLEKEVRELQDRVDYLESENETLEEEKCEFEEAENDTRLRLQRLEVELEILNQRNTELEVSREALNAKYKDCRSECLILREDLAASENRLDNLEAERQTTKANTEFLQKLLPAFTLYGCILVANESNILSLKNDQSEIAEFDETADCSRVDSFVDLEMGNVESQDTPPDCGGVDSNRTPCSPTANTSSTASSCNTGASTPYSVYTPRQFNRVQNFRTMNGNCSGENRRSPTPRGASEPRDVGTMICNNFVTPGTSNKNANNTNCCCNKLQEEINCLKHQLRQLRQGHQDALESADTHWHDLEQQYKEREKCYRSKEQCLKQKINQLEELLRADSFAANEKIAQMEESERELRTCLLRVSKEHREILDEHENVMREYECCKEENERLKAAKKPLCDALEEEKKRNKNLSTEICFLRKCQQEAEERCNADLKCLRTENHNLRREILNAEVTNGELHEEVTTLEQQLVKMQDCVKTYEEKIKELCDEIRSKEEQCQRIERRLERAEGFCLASELDGSPSKRCKRVEVNDLKTAAMGLSCALRNMQECETSCPQLQCVARDVKRLADSLIGEITCDLPDRKEVSRSKACADIQETSVVKEKSKDEEPKEEESKEEESKDSQEKAEEGSETVAAPANENENEKANDEMLEETSATPLARRSKGGSEGQHKRLGTGAAIVPELNFADLSATDSIVSKRSVYEVPSSMRKLDPPGSDDKDRGCSSKRTLKRVAKNRKIRKGFACNRRSMLLNFHKMLTQIYSKNPLLLYTPEAFLKVTSNHMIEKASENNEEPEVDKDVIAKTAQIPISSEMKNDDAHTKAIAVQTVQTTDSSTSTDDLSKRTPVAPRSPSVKVGGKANVDDAFYSIADSSEDSREVNYTIFENSPKVSPNFNYELETEVFRSPLATPVSQVSRIQTESAKVALESPEILSLKEQFNNIPLEIRNLMQLLKLSLCGEETKRQSFEERFIKSYESNPDFRDGLELIKNFFLLHNFQDKEIDESYEYFTKAMSCLQDLKEFAKPNRIPILESVDQKFHARLADYHQKKMEAQFYCTVYYPVKRPATVLDLFDKNKEMN